ncbi:kinetochore-associated Ndc80 complex subunit spc25 [Malassezia psittaci]|uniref:Kinetochore protein SPC25 n=1 Tax=Malassezia psittaci TaxID=1821823 RepID=A0AAF0JI75_9BASI|nr:kinetochore-associated Ndc80 complex subunit spc25 [Malassezia psittaci]
MSAPDARRDPRLDTEGVLDFSQLSVSIETFTQRFEQYVRDTVAASDAERLAADTHRVEAQEQQKALERQREASKQSQKQLWETVASERDADMKLRERVQNLHAQRSSLVQRAATLTNEAAEIRALIRSRRAYKTEKMQKLREQTRRNIPELIALQQSTGLTIEAGEQLGTLRFVFQHLTPHAGECALDLDVSQSKYSVPAHDARLRETTVRALLRDLNSSGDVFGFIKGLRKAMQAAVGS